MRNAISKKIEGIQPSGIRKFFDVVSEMPDAISLGVGEPDFDTPYSVREEGIYALEKGRTFYTSKKLQNIMYLLLYLFFATLKFLDIHEIFL